MKNADLPANTTRQQGTIVYRRPDNGRYVFMTEAGVEGAKEIATVLNAAFGPRPRNGMKYLYRSQFMRFDWSSVRADIQRFVIAKLPDIMPFVGGSEAEETIRHSWAYATAPTSALRDGLSKVSKKDLLNPCAAQWVQTLHRNAIKNARARKLQFDLTIEELGVLVARSDGKCEVSGISLSTDSIESEKRMRRPWAPSIDRKDSTLGYSLGNCRIVCCAANYAMSQWGEDVLVELAKAIARRRIVRPRDQQSGAE